MLDSVRVARASAFAGRFGRADGAAGLRAREGEATGIDGGARDAAGNAKHMPTRSAATLACKLLRQGVVKTRPSVR